jgi:hypothetical protein
MFGKIIEVLKYYRSGITDTKPEMNRLLYYFAKHHVFVDIGASWYKVNDIDIVVSTNISSIMRSGGNYIYDIYPYLDGSFYPKWLNQEILKSVEGNKL